MLDAHHQLGLAPLNVAPPGGFKRSPGRGQALYLGKKLYPRIPIQSDECCASIIQAFAVGVREQSPKRSSFAVAIRPDHDKYGFGKTFGLEPSLATARAIGCEWLFGNDALQPMPSTSLKEQASITYELLAELDAAAFILYD
jgi:hypothetical protein